MKTKLKRGHAREDGRIYWQTTRDHKGQPYQVWLTPEKFKAYHKIATASSKRAYIKLNAHAVKGGHKITKMTFINRVKTAISLFIS
jgi:hypothetical protein